QWLAAVTDVCELRWNLGQFSAAVATPEKGHRSPRSGRKATGSRTGHARLMPCLKPFRRSVRSARAFGVMPGIIGRHPKATGVSSWTLLLKFCDVAGATRAVRAHQRASQECQRQRLGWARLQVRGLDRTDWQDRDVAKSDPKHGDPNRANAGLHSSILV